MSLWEYPQVQEGGQGTLSPSRTAFLDLAGDLERHSGYGVWLWFCI